MTAEKDKFIVLLVHERKRNKGLQTCNKLSGPDQTSLVNNGFLVWQFSRDMLHVKVLANEDTLLRTHCCL